MAEKIPVFQEQSADFLQTIEVGGQLIVLRLTWNSRIEFWFIHDFSMSNFPGNDLKNMKLVKTTPIFRPHKALLPNFAGDFIMIKTDQNAGDEITYDNFGNGWDLLYITKAELDQWEVINGVE